MNERIRQLALQANPASKEIYESDNWEYNCAAWSAEDVEKFAELIVRDCALTAGSMEHERRKGIGAQILDNYGVEL